MKTSILLLSAVAAMSMSACNGMFDGIYDELPSGSLTDEGFFTTSSQPNRFTLKIDASDFGEWNYVSLKNMTVEKLAIPLACEGEWDGRSGITYSQVSGNQFAFLRSVATDAQPEPAEWDFAIHRFDVRTNGGAACSTRLADISQIGVLSLDALAFEADEWSTTQVMVDLADMMGYRIGYQNSYANMALSEWVKMDISTPPPTFESTGLVYCLRLCDGEMAAMQMRSYVNEKGEKGHLTIDIIYPFK